MAENTPVSSLINIKMQDGSFISIHPQTNIENVNGLTDALNDKVDKVSGKGLSTNDYTTTEKNKLSGIANNANNYSHPTTSGNKHIPSGGSSGQILRWSADGTAVWGNDNNTTYSAVGTTGDPGLMTAADKVKLDGIDKNANKITVDSALSDTSTNPVQNKVIKAAIDNLLSSKDAMIFKGTIGTGGTITALPNAHDAGWTYKVITAGTYAGMVCEVGDMIICIKDGTAANNADWTSVQVNSDGIVTGPATAVANNVVIFDGTTGKVIKDSGFTIGKSVPANAIFTDTVYTHPTTSGNKHIPSGGSAGQILRWSADGTAVWGADNNTTYTAVGTTGNPGLMTAADKVKLDGIAANANNYTHPTTTAATAAAVKVGKDSSGHVVIGAALTASDIGAATSNHGHNDVTTTAAGFMSVADKVKLNNLGVDFVTYTSADIS